MSLDSFDFRATFLINSTVNKKDMVMYGDQRIAIGVSLFFAMLIHYLCFGFAFIKKKEKIPRFMYLAKRLWLYNFLSALSIGLVQGSVYTAILSWYLNN